MNEGDVILDLPARQNVSDGGIQNPELKREMYYIYILASKRNGTLYIGVTSNLRKRVWLHKEKLLQKSFTAKYDVTKLVYFEEYHDIQEAIYREKKLKTWRRHWKLKLIEESNPQWKDLY